LVGRRKDPVSHLNKLYIIAAKDKKITKMMKRTAEWCGCDCHDLESLAAKPSTQLTSHSLWLYPSQFSSQKGRNFCPKTSFSNGRTIQSALPPQSGTFCEGVETIRQPSCLALPNITSADFFTFRN
jgi:hypothetical protein